jgi:hypothetical protein
VKVHGHRVWAPAPWTNRTQGIFDVPARLETFRIPTAVFPASGVACPFSGILGEIGHASPAGVGHHILGSSKARPQGLGNRTLLSTPVVKIKALGEVISEGS